MFGDDFWATLVMSPYFDYLWYLRCSIVWRLSVQLLDIFPVKTHAFIAVAIGISFTYNHTEANRAPRPGL